MVTSEALFLTVFVLNSQKRQAERDRIRGDFEYQVNLKAQMEIMHLHQKMDRLAEVVRFEWERMIADLEFMRVLINGADYDQFCSCNVSAARPKTSAARAKAVRSVVSINHSVPRDRSRSSDPLTAIL
jgi:uncharacterized membrane protein